MASRGGVVNGEQKSIEVAGKFQAHKLPMNLNRQIPRSSAI